MLMIIIMIILNQKFYLMLMIYDEYNSSCNKLLYVISINE